MMPIIRVMSKELIQETGVPHWLQPPKLDRSNEYTEWTWEAALGRVADGETLTSICRDPTMPDLQPFRRWIHSDAARRDRYYASRAIGAEKVEDELIDISDAADNPMEDTARSALRIQTRKWLLGVWNRDRYGEKKQIDQSVVVDIGAAMERAQKRVQASRQGRVIEGEVE